MWKICAVGLSLALGLGLTLIKSVDGAETIQPPSTDGSRAHVFRSLSELTADSREIVIARALSQSPVSIHGVRFTDTSMELSKKVKGLVPAIFRLRQLDVISEEGGPTQVVSLGHQYLLFLQPYQVQPSIAVASDLFVAVGATAGVYESGPSGFSKIDELSPDLPELLATRDVDSLMKDG